MSKRVVVSLMHEDTGVMHAGLREPAGQQSGVSPKIKWLPRRANRVFGTAGPSRPHDRARVAEVEGEQRRRWHPSHGQGTVRVLTVSAQRSKDALRSNAEAHGVVARLLPALS